jgi:hypothetical protein
MIGVSIDSMERAPLAAMSLTGPIIFVDTWHAQNFQ